MADDHDPEAFREKLRYWRERGLPLKYTYGRDAFHGPTGRELHEQERKTFVERNGYEPVPRSARAELI